MAKTTTNEIRSAFLDYFAENGHDIVASSSLVPLVDEGYSPGLMPPSTPTPRSPTLLEALLPLMGSGLFLAVGYAALGWRIEVMLLASAAVAGLVGRRLGYDWATMEKGVIDMRPGKPELRLPDTRYMAPDASPARTTSAWPRPRTNCWKGSE